MKRFLLSVAFCTSLLTAGLFVFLPSSEAQNQNVSPLPALLNLPAPPPPNPFYRPTFSERSEDFFSKKNPPSDDASIEDLMDYWQRQNSQTGQLAYTPKLTDKALKRILNEIERKPEKLVEYLNLLPESEETTEFVRNLHNNEISARKLDSSWRTTVQRWMTYHTPVFAEELYQKARLAADTKEYVTNQEDVLALARVNWEMAKPLLDKMLADSTQPVSQTLARWAYYKHALATGDSFDTEKYRRELQDVVENKSALPGNRDLAMDALVSSGDFAGRDEWYFSLLEDETLYELRVNGQVYTGLTTIINVSEPDRFLDKMVELAGSSSQTVRYAAVRNLITMLNDKNAPKIVRALVPWLSDPRWAKETGGERQRLVGALRTVAIPESVPGLIAMLNEKEKTQLTPLSANSNVAAVTNRIPNPNSMANVAVRTGDSYPFRSAAIAALEKQRSSQAAAALRQLLGIVEQWERPQVVRAILASNGFTITEQVEALEAVAKLAPRESPESNYIEDGADTSVSEEEVAEMEAEIRNMPQIRSEVLKAPPVAANLMKTQFDPNDLKIQLGFQMMNPENPSEELVKTVIDRIAFYDKRDPEMATGLRRIIQNWKGTAINSLFLRDLKDNKSNTQAIIRLIILRKELREKQLSDVTAIRGGSQTALGISACLLEQPEDYDAILSGGSDEAKTALFACARLIRAPLSVPKTAANLKSTNKLLALAAERYLETEDSTEARSAVLAQHPNEAKILGARMSFTVENSVQSYTSIAFIRDLFLSVDPMFARFAPYYFYNSVNDDSPDKRLQKEVKENQELLGVYSYDKNFVRIYKDKAVFSWEDDPARYRERALSAEEFEAFKNFLASQRVDELPPFLSPCDSCETKELLMLGKAGGRRIYLHADPKPQFFTELENIFEEFRRQPAQIRYYLEKDIPGLEVLFADDNLHAETVWKNGADLRLLIDDLSQRRQNEKTSEEVREEIINEAEPSEDSEENSETVKTKVEESKKRMEQIMRQSQYGSYAWFQFDKTKPLAPVAQPEGIWAIPPLDGFAVPPTERQWKARVAGIEVRADQTGLFKIKGGQLSKIRDGFYYSPLVTPNGRWTIAAKYSESEEDSGGTMRINLLTNKEFPLKMTSEYGIAEPIAFLASLNKVVLFVGYGESEDGDYEEGERDGEFFLLDAETGIVQPMRGDGRPLLQQTFRPLQTVSGMPDAFWAAIPSREKSSTEIGIYNAKTLSFKPLIKIPQIIFYSMEMWIDEPESKVYLVYEGQLLAMPLPKNR